MRGGLERIDARGIEEASRTQVKSDPGAKRRTVIKEAEEEAEFKTQ